VFVKFFLTSGFVKITLTSVSSIPTDPMFWVGVVPELIATRAPDLEVGVSTSDPTALLRLVQVVSAVSDDAARSLRDSVTSARAAGVSWDAIGTVLGTSRQAAQQRFADVKKEGVWNADPDKKVVMGVHVFTELDALTKEGADGWLLTAVITGAFEFERSDYPVEYHRVRSLRKQTTIDSQCTDGWNYCCSHAVLHYFARPIRKPDTKDKKS
jgi:hypothetical protein